MALQPELEATSHGVELKLGNVLALFWIGYSQNMHSGLTKMKINVRKPDLHWLGKLRTHKSKEHLEKPHDLTQLWHLEVTSKVLKLHNIYTVHTIFPYLTVGTNQGCSQVCCTCCWQQLACFRKNIDPDLSKMKWKAMPESHAETCIGWALTFYQKIVMLTNHQQLASIKLQVLTLTLF